MVSGNWEYGSEGRGIFEKPVPRNLADPGVCKTVNNLRKGLELPLGHQERIEKVLAFDENLRSWEKLYARFVDRPVNPNAVGPQTSDIRSEELSESSSEGPARNNSPARVSPTRDSSARDHSARDHSARSSSARSDSATSENSSSGSDSSMTNFGTITPQVDLASLAAATSASKKRKLAHADGRPVGSSSTRAAREGVPALGSERDVRATSEVSSGLKRKTPSSRPELTSTVRAYTSGGRSPSIPARAPLPARASASPARASGDLVARRTGGSKDKQPMVASDHVMASGPPTWMPKILKEGGLTVESSLYSNVADSLNLLRELHTPKDDEVLGQKGPVDRHRMAAYYSWRAAMLLMKNEEVVVDSLGKYKDLQEAFMKLDEEKKKMSGELLVAKTKVVELDTKCELAGADVVRHKRRSERLSDEVRDLRNLKEKLEVELAAAEEETQKRVDEARAEFQRQMNEQVRKFYQDGHAKGYNDCLEAYDIIEADDVPVVSEPSPSKGAEDTSILSDVFPSLKDATGASGSASAREVVVELEQEAPPAREVVVELEQESAPGREGVVILDQDGQLPTPAVSIREADPGVDDQNVVVDSARVTSPPVSAVPLAVLPPLEQTDLARH